jgi:hypothetical protein
MTIVRDEKGHILKGHGGRPKGALNRFRTVAANNPLRYDGRNAAEELHRIGFDEKVALADRTKALAAAAPYFTPKGPQYIRTAIDVPLIRTVGDALTQIARLITLAANQELGLDEARSLIANIKDWVADQQPRTAHGPYSGRAAGVSSR